MKKIIIKHWFSYLLTVLLSIGAAFLFSSFSVKLGSVIDVVVKNESGFSSKILSCVVIVLAWFVVSMLFSFMKSKNISDIIREVKRALYIAINQKEMSDYVAKSNEFYLNNLTKNIDLLQENYLSPRCEIVSNFASAVVSIGTIFFIHWKLGLAFVGVSLVTIVLSQIPGLLMTKKTNAFSLESEAYLKTVNNHLRGFEQIKLLGLSKVFFDKYLEKDDRFENSRFGFIFVSRFANNLGLFFSFFAQLGCMSIGVWFALKGEISVGLLISAINLLNGVFNPLQNLSYNKNLMRTVHTIMNGFNELLSTPIEKGQEIQGKIRSISLENISLQFEDKKIFDHYSTHFEADKKYAIVGESGRGKSTLVKLIMKYYEKDNYSGTIKINDQDVQNISSHALYTKIAYIQRNDFYVDGTVEDNIVLYRKNKPDNKLCKSLKFNDDFLKKPIEEGSRNQVSMGEKQRIDIARFLLEDYDVLIFDEPTSNLDSETANMVFDLIFGIKNKTIIVITHIHDEAVLKKFDEVIRV